MKPTPVLVATDFVLFGIASNSVYVLLIQRLNPPFQNNWALPGGFLDANEDLKSCALRELAEETSVVLQKAEQVGIYDSPNRDPRGRVISVAYTALIEQEKYSPQAADDARSLKWHPLQDLPKLAFDHASIIKDARQKLKL
jgi:8-oxo-dGTP diphosphatase